MYGVVRGADGRFTGLLSFTRAGANLATLGPLLPVAAASLAMQVQLARIEKKLDAITADLDTLINNKHVEIEAAIGSSLEVLGGVYHEIGHSGRFDDDQWDRIAPLEREVRALFRETRAHLHALDRVLADEDASLPTRVKTLSSALHNQRTSSWLRARVHAELALSRWDLLYLARQVQEHPDQADRLVLETENAVSARRAELIDLANRVASYLARDGRIDRVLDRLRIVSQGRLRTLLLELDQVCLAFNDQLSLVGVDQREFVAVERSTQWRQLVAGTQSFAGKGLGAIEAGAKGTTKAAKDAWDKRPGHRDHSGT